MPKRPVPPHAAPKPVALEKAARVRLTDAVQLPRVILAWHSPGSFLDGDAECDLLAAMLGGGHSSRLYQALVYDQKLAESVEVEQRTSRYGSQLVIVATAQSGHTSAELEKAIEAELAARRLAADGARGRAGARVRADQAVARDRGAGAARGRARLVRAALRRRRRSSPSATSRATTDHGAAQVRPGRARCCTRRASPWSSSRRWQMRSDAAVGCCRGDDGAAPASRISRSSRRCRRRRRGARRRRTRAPSRRHHAAGDAVAHELPLVHVLVTIPAGSASIRPIVPGSPPRSPACCKTAAPAIARPPEVAEEFADARHRARGAHRHRSGAARRDGAVAQPRRALALLTDLVTRPRFDAADWQRAQARRIDEDPSPPRRARARRRRRVQRVLYGDHPYGHPFLGTEESVRAISVADLRAFWAARYARATSPSCSSVTSTPSRALGASDADRGAAAADATDAEAAAAARRARRSPGRAAVAGARRPPRRRARHARLRRAVAARDRARRLVHLAPQPQPAREARLHLRRARELRSAHRRPGRSSPRAGVRTDVTAAALKETVAEIAGMRAPLSAERAEEGAALVMHTIVERSATATRLRTISPTWSRTACRSTAGPSSRRSSRALDLPTPTRVASRRLPSRRAHHRHRRRSQARRARAAPLALRQVARDLHAVGGAADGRPPVCCSLISPRRRSNFSCSSAISTMARTLTR